MLAPVTLAILAALLLSPTLVQAQEKEPPAPWVKMTGKNAGAVGTCVGIDGSDTDFDCYLVRCDAGKLLFVYQPNDTQDRVRSMQMNIGNYTELLTLDPLDNGVGTIALDQHPKFLAALTSGETWANWQTGDADFDFSTSFELTNAKKRIASVQQACKG